MTIGGFVQYSSITLRPICVLQDLVEPKCLLTMFSRQQHPTVPPTPACFERQGKLGTMGNLVGTFGSYGICGDVCKFIADNKDVENAEYVQTVRFPEKKRIITGHSKTSQEEE